MEHQVRENPGGGQADEGHYTTRRPSLISSSTARSNNAGSHGGGGDGGSGLDDSFAEAIRDHPTISSIPTGSSSWETDAEQDRGGSRPDRRKFIDVTTPTLIDEDYVPSDDEDEEDEEEMISLDKERMRREMMMQNDSTIGQTPGASISVYAPEHSSVSMMRRTPGAVSMHNSSRHTSVSTTEFTDSALLGFGLTLSTPVAADVKGVFGQQQLAADSFSSSSSETLSPSSRLQLQKDEADKSTTRSSSIRDPRDSRAYTPAGWTLSKNPHLEVSHGAFSPNTLRLTEDLDNLLLDDEDTKQQQVFREASKSTPSIQPRIEEGDADSTVVETSWTASYIFGQDGGQAQNARTRRKSVKPHKGRSDGGRRSAARELASRNRDEPGLSHAHPKPLRQGPGIMDSSFSSFASRNESPYQQGQADEDEGPRPLLNFGGAFVPPSQVQAGNFRRPVPSAFRCADAPSIPSEVGTQQTEMVSSPQLYGGFRPTNAPFQSMSQPPFASQFGSIDMRFSPPGPPGNYGNDALPLNYGTSTYGVSTGQPSVGFQGTNPYVTNATPMGQPMGQAGPWSQPIPMNYNSGMGEGGWHGGNASRGWGSTGDFGYGHPASGMMDARMHLTPSPQFSPWQQKPVFGPTENMQYPSQHMNQQGWGFYGFSGEGMTSVKAPGGHGHGVRGPPQDYQQAQARRGHEDRTQRNADQKKNAAYKDTSKGKDAERTKGASSPTKKKRQGKGRVLSPTKTTANQPYQRKESEEGATFASEDAADAKRPEIDESPEEREAYKEFYRQYRAKERSSFKDAEEFAKQTLANNTLPEKVLWRVHLELADIAKRTNRIVEAKELYRRVCELQPYASQGWLEYSKLEEECGHLNRCARILSNGLEYCEYSESLLTRAIKHAEKMGNLDIARQLLARLKHVGIEKVWRCVLEGALLEARQGNLLMARRVLKYLMHNVGWYGPLYVEAYRLEKDQERLHEALAIVEKGLTAIPRYGPLWFGAFRLCEALDMSEKNYHMPRTIAVLTRATHNISRELVWKIHLDTAQILERAAFQACDDNSELDLNSELRLCRHRFALTATKCPQNLCWKVWLASGRMELTAGNTDRARSLFLRAQKVVPAKGRAVTLVECARLEEFVGNAELARAILTTGRFESKSDWKVWLESVLLEVRTGEHLRAVHLAKRALEVHNGTGRLWACFVQLRRYDGGEESQFCSLKRALMAVPKSGEVWCEGGRIHLNPFSNTFDLTEARRHLFFATRFTPQYGDSFLETMKLEILEQWIAPVSLYMWQVLQPGFLEKISDGTAGADQDSILAGVVQVAASTVIIALSSDKSSQKDGAIEDSHEADMQLIAYLREGLSGNAAIEALDNTELELRCSNADPNYGLLWFHSRKGPTNTAKNVLLRGRGLMIDEITSYVHLYVAAMVRRYAIITTLRHQNENELSRVGSDSIGTEGLEAVEALLDSRLRAAPSLKNMLQAGKQTSGTVLLESSVTEIDFVTGYVELNRVRPLETLSLKARRKALFGSDALFS